MNLSPTNQQGRNERCKCGSGLKFKKCHGDPTKIQQAMAVADETMIQLIYEEVKKHGKGTESFVQ